MRPHTYILFSLSLIALLTNLSGQSSVWKISKGDQHLYLGGTCHMLRADDYPLPQEFEHAYEQAHTLVFEIDPAALNDPAFATELMAKARYNDGRSLKTVLSPEAYSALENQGKQSNLPIALFDSMKPGMVMMMITMQELAKQGVHQEGVDLHYHQRGLKDGKTILALEDPSYQIELIVNMGEGQESELVLFGLQDLDQMGNEFGQIIAAWRTGDLQRLQALFIDDLLEFPQLYQDLISDRNLKWLPQLEDMLQTPEIEFVLVGVGHAVGQDGVLTHLRNNGYHIEQIRQPTAQQ